MHADDMRLLGIPRSRPIITRVYPHHAWVSEDSPVISDRDNLEEVEWMFLRHPNNSSKTMLVEPSSVARVPPRTSKGITDLLLPHASIGLTPIVPLRSKEFEKESGCKDPEGMKRKMHFNMHPSPINPSFTPYSITPFTI
jgi:hypothetical protein